MKNAFILAIITIVTVGCGPSKFVEPLAHKQLSIGGHFGGPTLDRGIPIPLPLTAVEVGYGIDTNITLYSTLHTTAIFFGDFQMDFGATFKLFNQKKYVPNISVSPGFQFIYSPSGNAGSFWPTADANAYWNYGKRKSYFYLGINNYFELTSTMANDQPQAHHWLFSPQVGHVLKGKHGHSQFTAEIKWLGPNHNNDYAFLPYFTPQGSQGALGIYFGYRWLLKNK